MNDHSSPILPTAKLEMYLVVFKLSDVRWMCADESDFSRESVTRQLIETLANGGLMTDASVRLLISPGRTVTGVLLSEEPSENLACHRITAESPDGWTFEYTVDIFENFYRNRGIEPLTVPDARVREDYERLVLEAPALFVDYFRSRRVA